MRIWQVTPLTRKTQASLVAQRFRAQRHPDKRLCFVANGAEFDGVDAEAWLRHAGVACDLALQTERGGKPAALNAALDALHGETIAIRDDDDRSLPLDLHECAMAMASTGAEIVSRLRHRVIMGGANWLFAERHAEQWGDHRVWGGSLLFRATHDTPRFPPVLVTESQSWARRMVELGARIWRPSIDNQVYVRDGAEKMWQACAIEVRATLGMGDGARRYNRDGSFRWMPCPDGIACAEAVSRRASARLQGQPLSA